MNTIYTGTPDSRLYKEVLGKTIGELLETDEKVVYLDADLMSCIGTAKLPEKFDRARYVDYAAALDERCKAFWQADEGVLVYTKGDEFIVFKRT